MLENYKIVFFLFIIIFSENLAISQVSEEWIHRYTGPESSTDNPASFVIDGSGNFYVTGKSIVGGGYFHIVTVKFNSSGVRQWIANYSGGPGQNDDGISIKVDQSGNVYVAGNTRLTAGQFNMLLIKYNATGVQLWVQEYNGPANSDDFVTGCVIDPAGDIYLGGYSFGSGTGYDYVLLKYDPAGVLKWVKRWNGISNADDYLKKINIDKNGNIILTGNSYNSSSLNNFVTQKYNSEGTLIWSAIYNGLLSLDDQPSDIQTDTSGNIYVCGKSKGTGVGYNYATIKYNSSGVQQWASVYDSPVSNDDVPNAIDVDQNGNVFTAGNSFSSGSFADYATVKYNSAGVQQWVRNYNGAQNYFDKAADVKTDNAGNVYVTGQNIKSSDGTSDLVTVKYNFNGDLQWSRLYNGLGNLDDVPVQMEIINSELFILGTSSSYFFGPFCGTSDYVTVKYNLSGNFELEARYDGSGTGVDEPNDLVLDNSGNTFCTGSSFDQVSEFDYATIKYNSAGAPLWVTRYDGFGGSDKASSIITDNSGNIYVTGVSENNSNGNDIATIKYNSAGTQQWVARYNGPANGDDHGSNVAADASGNVYVSGYSEGLGSGKDYVIIKYNSSGSQQWATRYNGPGNSDDSATAMAFDPAGNIFVTGKSKGIGTLEDIATIKCNLSGSIIWVSRFNGVTNNSDEPASIALDGGGNVIVTGKSNSGSDPVESQISNFDIITLKINSAGIQQWSSIHNGSGNGDDEGSSVVTDNSGNVYVAGSSKSLTTDKDYSTIKYNSAGVQQWVSYYNGNSNNIDQASSITIDIAGNLFVTGACMDAGSGFNYCTVKYNNSGIQKWAKKYNYIDNDTDKAAVLKVDTQGNVFVTGISKGVQGDKDFITIKYKQDKAIELNALIEGFYNEVSNIMVSDTVKLFLRNSASPYSIVDSSISVLDNLGKATYYFANAQNSINYFLVLKHRNSIETWSSTTQVFSAASMNYDFTTDATKAFGNNLKNKGLEFCIYSGDVNQDGIVDASDGSFIDNDVFIFLSGRNITDLNGDEIIDGSDLSIADNNSLNFIGLIRP
ncbi:MAG: SBBP repeat-containing protein [Ignavibacteria bacterium]